MQGFAINASGIVWRPLVVCLLFLVAAVSNVAKASVELNVKTLPSTNKFHYIVIPFPNFTVSEQQGFTLKQQGVSLKFTAHAHLLWPKLKSTAFYRGVLFKVEGLEQGSVELSWGEGLAKPDQALSFEEAQLAELHYPETWLNKALYSPLIYNANNIDWGWLDNAYWRYAAYSADEAIIEQVSKPKDPAKKTTLPTNSAAPWLYDRPFTFYQLYFKTADPRWKKTAHQQAQFFMSQLDDNGDFALKGSADLKYMLSGGLLIDYLFYPYRSTKLAIEKMTQKGLAWPARYSTQLGFWTERHLSVALSLALNQWELHSDEQSSKRVEQLLEGIREDLWVSAPGQGGCIKHSLKAHSNKNSKDMVCSPWMSALVVEQLWRYFWMTDDQRAAELIIDFSDMLLHHGLYTVEYKGKTLYIPDYLVFFKQSIFQDRNSWTERQHACDVAGMVYKGVYLKRQRQQDEFLLELLAQELLNTCEGTMDKKGKKAMSNPNWSLKPLRKFNWWFASNGSLTWLLKQ
ncbi:hypothetical protein F9L16_22040 [Agarivorans sp. B2Z047]|uniref:hypothetical protein n=1 Tax=Agarivorans sp. B2Z047 TaxID=2652721 RepID=UPI00128BBB3E|nr:hypothetical protein [Agarivorans sp. B2Z047]MPW31660.1 hypothetical protein [Agarivorans sp. B2Z047]UQN42380.1 hypothetical protein LQZ07_21795 [Agarivorans sp. B2Z047]